MSNVRKVRGQVVFDATDLFVRTSIFENTDYDMLVVRVEDGGLDSETETVTDIRTATTGQYGNPLSNIDCASLTDYGLWKFTLTFLGNGVPNMVVNMQFTVDSGYPLKHTFEQSYRRDQAGLPETF